MVYKLASRDNIDGDRLETWPAIPDKSFKFLNNTLEDPIFNSEDDILNWLESRSRTKTSIRTTTGQEFKNGDPNKLYSVYKCEHENCYHDNNIHDIFLYSLRFRKQNESCMSFINEKGNKLKSSFKKIDVQHVVLEDIEYSSDIREINKEFFEGIYPIDIDGTDPYCNTYIKFVKKIHEMDNEDNKKNEISYVVANNQHVTKWINYFLDRLGHIERFIEFFNRGGDMYINIAPDEDHKYLINYIFEILSENENEDDDEQKDDDINHYHNPEKNDLFLQIKTLIMDPKLCDKEIFQIRYNKRLVTWHRNYNYMIKKFSLIPSKQFSEMIMHFNLSDFFKQYQSRENLTIIIRNLENMYGIKRRRNIKKNNDTCVANNNLQRDIPYHKKFNRISRTFDDLFNNIPD